jgi:hypothetical protein
MMIHIRPWGDIAKNVFQVHGLNCNGRVVLKRRVLREELLSVVAQIDRCTVIAETLTGAFFGSVLGLGLITNN